MNNAVPAFCTARRVSRDTPSLSCKSFVPLVLGIKKLFHATCSLPTMAEPTHLSSKTEESSEPESTPKLPMISCSTNANIKTEDGLQGTTAPTKCIAENGLTHAGQPDQSLLVDWDGPRDPENPLNFTTVRKCWITCMTALMNFIVSFGSSVFSAAVTATAIEFGTSKEVMTLGVTLYVVGFACGK